MNKLIQGLAITGALLVSSVASAAVTEFSDKYEGYTVADTNALDNAGYVYFVNVETHPDPVGHTGTPICTSTDPGGGDFGYGGPAPNITIPGDGPRISSLTDTEAGLNQGVQGLSVFADYNNTANFTAGCQLETNVYREQTIDLANEGETWVLRFDYKGLTGGIPGTAGVFIKVLDPGAGFATTDLVPLDVTAAPDTWTEIIEISFTIPAGYAGRLIQFGFVNVTDLQTDASTIFYDNVCWFESVAGDGVCASDSSVAGGLVAFADNFEGYGAGPYTNELGNAGYLHFNNVFAVGGAFKFGYGPFPAPSAGPQISAIANGEGGVPQGTYQLSVYSDYDCCTAGTEGHGAGELVETNVFQEQTIVAADVGSTWQFAFDSKLGNLAGSSTALAFIKTLDGSNNQVDFVTVDLTTQPATWTNYSLSLAIDASKVGYKLQFGFSNSATNFEGSGVFYDNISWDVSAGCVGNGTDTDLDGIDDNCDNCTLVANGPNTFPAGDPRIQRDADGDGYGSLCDADFDNDCSVGFPDLTLFSDAFFGTDDNTDMDGDGAVGFPDLTLFSDAFFGFAGPSGVGTPLPAGSPNPNCP